MLEPNAKDNLEGDTLDDRYVILSLLGAGSTCKVYLAQDKSIDRKVAIKVFHERREQKSAKRLQRFQREIKSLSKLNHENIIKLHSVGLIKKRNNQPYMVMDYVHGRTLEEVRTEEEPLSSERIVHIASQIASALYAAHETGVIHRDIKPGNVYIVETEQNGVKKEVVKLLDFGMSRMEEELAGQTQSTSLCGTPAYMSPEQCVGKEVDYRTDIYSVGCLLYELVTGQPPFSGGSNFEILDKHIREPVPTITDYHCDGLLDIIMTCLEKRPADRYQSAADLQRDLLLCHKQRFKTVGRRAQWRIPVAILLTMLVVAGAFVAYPYLKPASKATRAFTEDERAKYNLARDKVDQGMKLLPAQRFDDADKVFQEAISLVRVHSEVSEAKLLWIKASGGRIQALNGQKEFWKVPVALEQVVPVLQNLTPTEIKNSGSDPRMNIYLHRGIAYSNLHKPQEALADFKEVLNMAYLSPEVGMIAAINACMVSFSNNDPDGALAFLREAHNLVRQSKQQDKQALLLASACNSFGDGLRQRKDMNRSNEAYNLAMSIAEPVSAPDCLSSRAEIQASAKLGRAIVLVESDQPKAALSIIESLMTESKKKTRTAKESAYYATLLGTRGTAKVRQKDYAGAADDFAKAGLLCGGMHYYKDAAELTLNAANLNLTLKNFKLCRDQVALVKDFRTKIERTDRKEDANFRRLLQDTETALANEEQKGN